MIFVTVGTHEQPFDRLIREVDRLKENRAIDEDVFIQTGYSSYAPRFAEHRSFLKFAETQDLVARARIVISHGGPASFMPALHGGKIPVVVPRQKKYGEHVDDHQVLFCRRLAEEGRILAVLEIQDLEMIVRDYAELIKTMRAGSRTSAAGPDDVLSFCRYLDDLCGRMSVRKKK